jgi:hypothetical protein
MPFHFCADELYMLLSLVPLVGIYFRRIHIWYHIKFRHKCHEKQCNDTHVDHNEKDS